MGCATIAGVETAPARAAWGERAAGKDEATGQGGKQRRACCRRCRRSASISVLCKRRDVAVGGWDRSRENASAHRRENIVPHDTIVNASIARPR